MKRLGLIGVVLIAGTALLGACTPESVYQELYYQRVGAQGSFSYLTSDGFGEGGAVKFDLQTSRSGPSCPSFGIGRICSQTWSGTMNAGSDFTELPGAWQVSFEARSACDYPYSSSACDVRLELTDLTTPDGANGVIGPNGGSFNGRFIDAELGCAGKGVAFTGTGKVKTDPAVSADVSVVICSPGLAAQMAAVAA